MEARDASIRRIELATATMRRINGLKVFGEDTTIYLPNEFDIFGKYALEAMKSYVFGFALSDNGTKKCFYGSMGSLASLLYPTLYRGELCDYGKTSGFSHLGRQILADIPVEDYEAKLFHFFIEQVRKVIFSGFLSFFRQFHEFPFGEPIDGLLAQHYGLSTQFLDLTDDIKVALFFASCIHEGNNQYRPITEEDICNLGKYGVLYYGTNENASIIGFQPFSRCHRQRGYYLDTAGSDFCWSFALNQENGFEKVYFERTVELSQRIYNEFDGGKKLFPEDGLMNFRNTIQQICELHEFPEEAFDVSHKLVCKYLKLYYANGMIDHLLYSSMLDKQWWLQKLEDKGFRLCSKIKVNADPSLIDEMNRKWDPSAYAKDEGVEYVPFLVNPVDNMR